MKLIQLSSESKILHIEKGDRLLFTYTEHVSVGYTADFEIEDLSVLRHLETTTVYDHPEMLDDPMITGADEAKTTFLFEALSEGTTLLLISKYFRFEVEESLSFRIHVKNK